MTTDRDPTLEDDMRAWLRRMVDAVVTDPAERAARYAEIDRALGKLAAPATDEAATGA